MAGVLLIELAAQLKLKLFDGGQHLAAHAVEQLGVAGEAAGVHLLHLADEVFYVAREVVVGLAALGAHFLTELLEVAEAFAEAAFGAFERGGGLASAQVGLAGAVVDGAFAGLAFAAAAELALAAGALAGSALAWLLAALTLALALALSLLTFALGLALSGLALLALSLTLAFLALLTLTLSLALLTLALLAFFTLLALLALAGLLTLLAVLRALLALFAAA